MWCTRFRNFLRIYCGNTPLEWDKWIDYYQFAYNTTIHTATGKTPYELVFGKICNLPSNLSDTETIDPIYNLNDYSRMLKFKLQVSQKKVKEMLQREKSKRVQNYNKSTEERIYNTGDLILIKNETGSKMDNVYNGPFKIMQDLGPNVEIEIGKTKDIVHKSRIKHLVLQK